MRRFGKFAGSAAAMAIVAISAPALAQEPVSAHYGDTTVTIGGGTALLGLPDVEFTNLINTGTAAVVDVLKDSEDFIDELGYNINGSIATPLGGNRQLVLGGFFARTEDDDSVACTSAQDCYWFNIDGSGGTLQIAGLLDSTVINSDRDVDHWGGSLESRWLTAPAVMGVTQAPLPKYFAVGADIRGIDQDLSIRTTRAGTGTVETYNEDLDTRYYGGYVAYGGDYKPFLLKGLWESWGLVSSFQARAGLYYVDTDYSGRMSGTLPGALNLSKDDVAFIGGLSLIHSKQISPRASLSLRSDYEYYSWVPEMSYANDGAGAFTGPNAVTRIGDDDAFSMRTSLRLTIKLGPREIMEPMK